MPVPQRTSSLLLGLLLTPQLVSAEEWLLNGALSQSLGYQDNVRMRQQAQGSYEYFLTPTLNAFKKDVDWSVGGTASYGLREYTEIKGMSNSPQSYSAMGDYRTERSRWGLNASYSESQSRTTAETDTGDFSSTATVIGRSVSPSYSYSLNATDSINLSGSYYDSVYSGRSFSNNAGESMSLGWQRQWSSLLTQSVSSFYSHNAFSGRTQGSTDSYGVNVMLAYQFSPLWDVKGTAGGRISELAYGQGSTGLNTSPSSSSTGFLADFSVNYKGALATSSLNLGRSISPSGQGVLSEQTYASLSYGYKFAEHWDASVSGSYRTSQQVGQSQSTNSNSFNNRTNIGFEPRLNWLMSKDWNTSLSYRYQQQSSRYSSDSNTLMLTVTYNWPGFNISR